MDFQYDSKLFKDMCMSYKDNEVGRFREFVLWFSQTLKDSILTEDEEKMKNLYKELACLKSDIEYTEPVEHNREYYLGFLSAYGNMTKDYLDKITLDNKISENDKNGQDAGIEAYLSGNGSRLKEIIHFLGSNGYSFQNQIASGIGISENNLSNILNRASAKKLDLFTSRKIGRNVLYGLSRQGEEYYLKTRDKKSPGVEIIYYIDTLQLAMQNSKRFENLSLAKRNSIASASGEMVLAGV